MGLVKFIVEVTTNNSYYDEPARDREDAERIAANEKQQNPDATVKIEDASWLYKRIVK